MPFAVLICVPALSFTACLAILTDWSQHKAYVPFMFLALSASFSIVFSLLSSWVLAKLFPVGLSADGIHGSTFWGCKSFVPWHEIGAVKPFALLNLQWLRIYSSQQGKTTWIPMFLSQPADFLDALGKLGASGNPLLGHLKGLTKTSHLERS